MSRLLSLLGGSATRVLFFGIFIGLLLPPLAALCRPLLAPAVLALLLAGLLRVEWSAMFGHLRRPFAVALLVASLLIVSPLLVWQLVAPLGAAEALPPVLIVALVLMAAAPPILSATSITGFLGLDSALAIVTAVAATLLVPLTLPPLALALIGVRLDITLAEFMLRLGLLVVGAALGALLLRRLAGPQWLAARGRQIDGVAVLAMLIFGIAVMDGVSASLLARPASVLFWLAVAFAANLLLQLAGAAAFAWLGARGALTAGLLLGNRNMGLLLAALPAGANPDIALFMALAQIPIYTLPAALQPLLRRLLRGPDGPGAGLRKPP